MTRFIDVNRDRILKALVLVLLGASIGAGVGGTIVGRIAWSVAEDQAADRAYYARCLFRVAERHVGHKRLIAEWRAEIQETQSPDTEARQ